MSVDGWNRPEPGTSRYCLDYRMCYTHSEKSDTKFASGQVRRTANNLAKLKPNFPVLDHRSVRSVRL